MIANETAMAVSGYIISSITLLGALAWFGLRHWRGEPGKVAADDQTSWYAFERLQTSRRQNPKTR